MSAPGPSSEESPNPTTKRERKPNIRLGDLGDRKPYSKPSRSRNRRSTDPPPDSGTENKTETPDSESKRSKPSRTRNRRSSDPSSDRGTENQTETPDSGSNRPKRPHANHPADNSGPENQLEISDTPARVMISDNNREVSPILDVHESGGAHDVAAEGNHFINQNGGSGLADMGGVHGWLERLELARYEPVFNINEVDETVLPMLTLEDLRDMGISAVGSRRKLHCAIQELEKGL